MASRAGRASEESVTRLAGGLLLLVAIWVAVYWWWEPRPRISIAAADESSEIDPSPSDGSSSDPEPAPRELPQQPPERPQPAPRTSPDPPRDQARASAPEAAIIPPEFHAYTVQKGDTFASIAQKFYGSSRLSSVIARANPFVTPDRLRPGRTLRVPKDPRNIEGKPVPARPAEPAPQPKPAAPDRAPTPPPPGSIRYDEARTYTVVSGDSLARISQRMYGTQANIDLIFNANRDKLSSRSDLKVGQVLVIPPGTGPAPDR